MAKLTVVVLAAFLLVALGRASATRTTITTTTVVDDDDELTTTASKGGCEEQMSMQKMKPCMMYLSGMTMATTDDKNPMSEPLEMCCKQLEDMDEQCRCKSLEMMMMMMQKEKGQWRGQKMEKMMQEAMRIPGMCGMTPKQCHFHMLSI